MSLISDTCGCREYFFTAVLMWYQQTYQVTNYVLQKRVFEKSASGDRYDLPGAVPGTLLMDIVIFRQQLTIWI